MKQIIKKIVKAVKKTDLYACKSNRVRVRIFKAIIEALKKSKLAIIPTGTGGYKIWNGKCYVHFPLEDIKSFITDAAVAAGMDEEEALDFHMKEKLWAQFRETDWKREFPMDEDRGMRELLIGFTNGYVLVSEKGPEFHNPDPGLHPTLMLPVTYDENAECPMFENFLNFAFPDEDTRKNVLQMFAHTMIPFQHKKYVKLDKAMFFVGPANGGKSVLLDIFKSILGDDNFETVQLRDLTNPDSFEIAQLEGKVAAFCSDTDLRFIDPTNLKNFISGEAPNAKVKHSHKSVQMRNYAKVIVASNEFPIFLTDDKEPYLKRFVFIPMRNVVPAEKVDRDLSRRIIDAERSGIINLILAAMVTLISQRNIKLSDVIERELEFAAAAGLHIEELLRDGIFSKSEKFTSQKKLFEVYNEFCAAHSYNCHVANSPQQFGTAMKAAGFIGKKKNNSQHFNCIVHDYE